MPGLAQAIQNVAARSSIYTAHSSYLYIIYITVFCRGDNSTAKDAEQQREVWHKHVLASDPPCLKAFRDSIRAYESVVFMGRQSHDRASSDSLNAAPALPERVTSVAKRIGASSLDPSGQVPRSVLGGYRHPSDVPNSVLVEWEQNRHVDGSYDL